MTKKLIDKADQQKLRENSFEGAPGGIGAMNYGNTYGTFSSPNVSQNPGQFAGSNDNKACNSKSNTAEDIPQTGSIQKDINAVFSKKDTPTPDEVITGIKFELKQMMHQDKRLAKERVLANLRKDPHFYGSLRMLGIDDKTMMDNPINNPMNESKHPNDSPAKLKVTPNIAETKKIFAEMAKANEKKYVVNSQIVDVMKELWAAKNQRSSWKTSK